MKKLLFFAVIALFVLAGCAERTSEAPVAPSRATITEVRHKLNDGRTVACLLWDADAGYDSGISCDWANAK